MVDTRSNAIELDDAALAEYLESRSGTAAKSSAGVSGAYIKAAAIAVVMAGATAITMGPDIVASFSSSAEGRVDNTHRSSSELRSEAPAPAEAPVLVSRLG